MIRQLVSIVAMQLAVAFTAAIGFWVASDLLAARSAAIGGLIAAVPGAFYAWRLIRSRQVSPKSMLGVHMAAEFGKLALTFLLFGATFIWLKEVSAFALFATYIVTLLVYWAALLMFEKVREN